MPYDVELKEVTKQFPASGGNTVLAVDNISLQIEQGEFFALLGPSGCGKTTTLRMIAGFESLTQGDLLVRGESMRDVPPFHRPVNTVFQDYALFPHMTVLKNIMFGLKMDGLSKKDAQKRAHEALELVELPAIADRKPTQLSGGQQQRVALARALVKRPAVLLLDEPLGALDLKLRKNMQHELKSMQRDVGITFIYVTHDQEEAMTMADRIAVMNQGQVEQLGTPRDVYEHPQSRFVADFIGETNFISGDLIRQEDNTGQVKLADNCVIPAQLASNTFSNNQTITVTLRPERIGIAPSGATIEAHLTALNGQVLETEYIGTDTRYTVQIAGNQQIVVRVQNMDYVEQAVFDAGDQVQVFWSVNSTTILNR